MKNNPCNAIHLHKRNVFATTLLCLDTLLYIGGKAQKDVNIFHKHVFRLTHSLSTHCETYCFAFQKRLFYTVKAQVLHRKRAAFAMPKRKYHFPIELSLQKSQLFFNDNIQQQQGNCSPNKLLFYHKNVWIKSPKKAYVCSRIHRPCHLTK